MDWKICFVVMGAIIPEPEGLSTNSVPDWSTIPSALHGCRTGHPIHPVTAGLPHGQTCTSPATIPHGRQCYLHASPWILDTGYLAVALLGYGLIGSFSFLTLTKRFR